MSNEDVPQMSLSKKLLKSMGYKWNSLGKECSSPTKPYLISCDDGGSFSAIHSVQVERSDLLALSCNMFFLLDVSIVFHLYSRKNHLVSYCYDSHIMLNRKKL